MKQILTKMIKGKRVFYIILVVIFFHIVNNYIWVKNNPTPQNPYQLYKTFRFYEILSNPGPGVFNLILKADRSYPPLYNFLMSVFILLFGASYTILTMSNLLYFIILIISAYGIGKRLVGSQAALLAIFLLSFYPVIFWTSRINLYDFAIPAVVSLSLFYLIRSDYFSSRKNSLFLGLCIGIGMLIKFTFVCYIIFPLFYVLIVACLDHNHKPKQKDKVLIARAINFGLTCFLGILISSIWYVHYFNKSTIIPRILGAGENVSRKPIFYELSSVLFYLKRLINEQISLFYFIIFAIGIVLLIAVRRFRIRQNGFILCWIFGAWFILTLVPPKESRFFMPILPAVALVSASAIHKIRVSGFRYLIIFSVIIFGLVQFFIFSYSPNYLYKHRQELGVPVFGCKVFYFPVNLLDCQKLLVDYKFDNILELISENSPGDFITIGVHPFNSLNCDIDALLYYAQKYNFEHSKHLFHPLGFPIELYEEFLNKALYCDYLIIEKNIVSGGQSEFERIKQKRISFYSVRKAEYRDLKNILGNFKLFKEVVTEDNNILGIYKKSK